MRDGYRESNKSEKMRERERERDYVKVVERNYKKIEEKKYFIEIFCKIDKLM